MMNLEEYTARIFIKNHAAPRCGISQLSTNRACIFWIIS